MGLTKSEQNVMAVAWKDGYKEACKDHNLPIPCLEALVVLWDNGMCKTAMEVFVEDE